MADSTIRTLRLLSMLQRRRFWPGSVLSERLEVSERTLRRDIERLRALGYVVESDSGVGGGYRLGNSGAGSPGLLLLVEDDEATALAVAVSRIASGTSELAEAALGALTKIVAMLTPTQRRKADAVRRSTAQNASDSESGPRLGVLDAVAAATRDHVRLAFAYTAQNGYQTERRVEPCKLVAIDARWYLVAFDLVRDDWRTFRLDRLERPVASREAFVPRPPPADDLHAFVRFNMREQSPLYEVEIEFSAPASDLQAAYGNWANIVDLGAERCRVTMETRTFQWPTYILATTKVPARVVGPEPFRAHLRAVAARLTTAVEASE